MLGKSKDQMDTANELPSHIDFCVHNFCSNINLETDGVKLMHSLNVDSYTSTKMFKWYAIYQYK